MTTEQTFLETLNTKYLKLHKKYESLFWDSYMGDNSLVEKRNVAQAAVDNFRSDEKLREKTMEIKNSVKSPAIKERLQTWVDYFDQYQTPKEAKELKLKIDALESKIGANIAKRKEGYIHPKTKKFVAASILKMRTMIRTHEDEAIRKACYEACEKLGVQNIDDYVKLVILRNEFAQLMGYSDFYDYTLKNVDKMTKEELFGLFGEIEKTSASHFTTLREIEKKKKGLRKPWNFAYVMTGDFTKEEDPYFSFDQAVSRWGRSFSELGIDFKGGSLQLDLLDRKGKYNNGFCHWPELVHYKNGKRVPASSNFTCNVVPGQIGSGVVGSETLFHEGGHAAHLLNTDQKDVCLNNEYAPMTAAWAETHSMFIDTIFSSAEWRTRYAKDAEGNTYPFELFERKERALNILRPGRMLGLIFVCQFEREVYELKNPTADKIIKLAKKNHTKYFDQSEASTWALQIPHIYSWDSSCSYHGYGLAEIALAQWREYFFDKYDSIVDNKNVGKEMAITWKWGASKDFKTAVQEATGKKLSSKAIIKQLNLSPEQVIRQAKQRITALENKKVSTKPINLNAKITMVHGKEKIADNSKSFEDMAEKYAKWVLKQHS